MLISNRERLDFLLKAHNEIRSRFCSTPQQDFYVNKLSDSWKRAARAEAYRMLPAFSMEEFHSLPVTPKAALKADPWNFLTVGLNEAAKYYETTGTSGQVTPTPRMFEDVAWNVVSVAQAWSSVLRPEDRVAVLLPSDVVPVGDLAVGVCEYLAIPHSRVYPLAAGISDWDRLIMLWRSFGPTVLFVAPGMALQLTRLLKQRGLFSELSETVRTLMLLGEVSTPALCKRLGRWWNASAYDASYGSTETGTLAATCGAGRLHLLTATNYVELAIDDTVVTLAEASRGRLVVTPLNLYARPLLRFDTGDEVIIGDGCGCGNAAPIVTVCGRVSDGVLVRGVKLTVHAVEDIVYSASTATGYLVELDGTGDHARLLLERDVNADRAAEVEEKLAVEGMTRAHLGLEWNEIDFVNTLPVTTKSGGSQKSWKRSNIRVVDRAS
ncbi:phenylacetate--CoA ligase family protein [Nocardia sp. NPDC052566]|uniref:phenylacetate--CoA ligase family protein n=1 Tax=Nocardia sp. NPDC052566 TaxID=3364330 RepID=UPI0037C73D4F